MNIYAVLCMRYTTISMTLMITMSLECIRYGSHLLTFTADKVISYRGMLVLKADSTHKGRH